MLGVFLASAILAAGATPVAPQAVPAAETAKPAPAAAPLVCHSELLPGSRLTTRVCMSAEEAQERSRTDRQSLQRAQELARPSADMTTMMMNPR